MGALPTRWFLKHASERMRKSCLGVIHTVAPNGGSPEFVGRFARGLDDRVGWKTRVVLGSTGWSVMTGASAIQGAYELLPFAAPNTIIIDRNHNPTGVTRNRNDRFFLMKLVDYVFTGANRPSRPVDWGAHMNSARKHLPQIRAAIQNYNLSAQTFHDKLKDYMFPRTVAICLTGKNTVQSVSLHLDNSGEIEKVVEKSDTRGDGTVPLWSQSMYLGGKNLVIPPGNHMPRRTLPAVYEINKPGIDHSDAFKKEGQDAGVFDKVYMYMQHFWEMRQQ